MIDDENDAISKDFLQLKEKYISPLASTSSKDQILNIYNDNIDSQICEQSSSTKRSLFTKTADISDDNLTLATGKLLLTYT